MRFGAEVLVGGKTVVIDDARTGMERR